MLPGIDGPSASPEKRIRGATPPAASVARAASMRTIVVKRAASRREYTSEKWRTWTEAAVGGGCVLGVAMLDREAAATGAATGAATSAGNRATGVERSVGNTHSPAFTRLYDSQSVVRV
jgi:hypothetical protein